MTKRLAYSTRVHGIEDDWEYDHQLSIRLTNARKACGMTTTAAAAAAGMTPATFRNLELGARRASAKTVAQLAQAYGVKITDLLPPPDTQRTPPVTAPCGHPGDYAQGLQITWIFNGVLIWECQRCGHRWPRFDQQPQYRDLHDRAVDLIQQFGHGMVEAKP